jgi:Neuraminidase (sialidase)
MKLRIIVVPAIGLMAFVATAPAQLPSPVSSPAALNSYAVGDASYDDAPRIATDGQGLWLAVWSSDEPVGGAIGTDRDILYTRSIDNGATWSAAAALNTNAPSDSGTDDDPQIGTDGNGTWLVVWDSTENLGGLIGTDTDILFARSTDNGMTWSAPKPVKTNAATDGATRDEQVQLATDGQGTWVVTWITEDGPTSMTDEDLLVARSVDNGVSWSPPKLLNTNGATDTGRELSHHLATDRLGKWVAVWNSNENLNGATGTDYDIHFARSSDNGATWTQSAALNTNASSDTLGDHEPRVATDGQGHWIAVWDSRENLGGVIGTDDDILFALSGNNGATWSAPAALNTNAGNDIGGDGYADIAIDPLRGWLVVWESYEDFGNGSENDIMASLSTDLGATWSPPAVFNTNGFVDGETYDAGPVIATDSRGQFVSAWYSDNDGSDVPGPDYDLLVARFGLPDCNSNFVADGVDIVSGTSGDCDGNNVPDDCQPDADANGTIDPCEPECGVCAQGVLPSMLLSLSLLTWRRRYSGADRRLTLRRYP